MKTFDLQGAADFLKVDQSTVKRMAQRGEIGAKVGRAWVFREEDLDTYLREITVSQTAARKAALAPIRRPPLVRRQPLPELQNLAASDGPAGLRRKEI